MCPHISILDNQDIDLDTLGYSVSLEMQEHGISASIDGNEYRIGFQVRPKDYWSEVKKELCLLFCTRDKKYSDIRARFSKDSHAATTTIVVMLSATVASQIGAGVGIVTPLVALLLYAILKLGVNTWCNLQSPPSEEKKESSSRLTQRTPHKRRH